MQLVLVPACRSRPPGDDDTRWAERSGSISPNLEASWEGSTCGAAAGGRLDSSSARRRGWEYLFLGGDGRPAR